MKYCWQYELPVGQVTIAETREAISHLVYNGETRLSGYEAKETTLIKETAKQLNEYFSGKRRSFDLPLCLSGTPFQKSVWTALQTIPYGETRSYGQIAMQIGNPKAARAVGMANNRNPVSVIVPCHRVIGADGSLTGYGGGLHIKRCLLELEQPGV